MYALPSRQVQVGTNDITSALLLDAEKIGPVLLIVGVVLLFLSLVWSLSSVLTSEYSWARREFSLRRLLDSIRTPLTGVSVGVMLGGGGLEAMRLPGLLVPASGVLAFIVGMRVIVIAAKGVADSYSEEKHRDALDKREWETDSRTELDAFSLTSWQVDILNGSIRQRPELFEKMLRVVRSGSFHWIYPDDAKVSDILLVAKDLLDKGDTDRSRELLEVVSHYGATELPMYWVIMAASCERDLPHNEVMGFLRGAYATSKEVPGWLRDIVVYEHYSYGLWNHEVRVSLVGSILDAVRSNLDETENWQGLLPYVPMAEEGEAS